MYNDISKKLASKLVKYEMVRENLKKNKKALKKSETRLKLCSESLTFAQHVARLTQQELEQRISDIVTPAIQAIFGKPYQFKIKYIEKRKKTEAEIYLIDEDGFEFNPLEDNGGGIVDVVSLALRIACWKIKNPKPAPVLLYDEPMKFVSEDFHDEVCELLIALARELELQVIMVTHIKTFINAADNVIRL